MNEKRYEDCAGQLPKCAAFRSFASELLWTVNSDKKKDAWEQQNRAEDSNIFAVEIGFQFGRSAASRA